MSAFSLTVFLFKCIYIACFFYSSVFDCMFCFFSVSLTVFSFHEFFWVNVIARCLFCSLFHCMFFFFQCIFTSCFLLSSDVKYTERLNEFYCTFFCFWVYFHCMFCYLNVYSLRVFFFFFRYFIAYFFFCWVNFIACFFRLNFVLLQVFFRMNFISCFFVWLHLFLVYNETFFLQKELNCTWNTLNVWVNFIACFFFWMNFRAFFFWSSVFFHLMFF